MAASESIKAKAEQLIRDSKVKKDIETERRIHFLVEGTEDVHSVIYDKEKSEWTCDCRYSSLYHRPCSHVLAAKFLLKNSHTGES